MWVAGQKDVFKDFKIDKRAQIVIVARSWVGAIHDPSKPRWHGPCWGFAAEVYNHVGLKLSPFEANQYKETTEDVEGSIGSLIFCYLENRPDENPSHVSIYIGGGKVVDINCSKRHPEIVLCHEIPPYHRYKWKSLYLRVLDGE